jgi:hypothetical protein
VIQTIDHVPRDGRADRRAAPASAETPVRPDECLADIRRAVHHDGAVARAIVDAAIEPIEPQRVAIPSDVGISRDEEPKAGLVRLVIIRKLRRHIAAAALPVRDKLFIDQLS